MAYIPPTDWELRDFYREHADTVYRSCMLFTDGQADCRTMTKEIFLKLLDRGMEFSTALDAKAWMILAAYKMRKKATRAAQKGSAVEVHSSCVQEPDPAEQVVQTENEQIETEKHCVDTDAPETVQEETLCQSQTLENDDEAEACCEESVSNERVSDDEKTVSAEKSAPQVIGEEKTDESVPELSATQVRDFSSTQSAELKRLSSRERLVAILYYCEGFRKTEIASYLGCTVFAIRRTLKRIGRRIPGAKGGLLLRVFLRDVYQHVEFPQEEKELLMEELVDQRLKTTDRRSRKWRPRGQWGSWLLITMISAAVIYGLYFGAEYLGILDIVRTGTEQMVNKLEEIAPAETTLPLQTQPTDEMATNTPPPVSMEEVYDPFVLRYIEALEQAWDPGRCMDEDISLLVGFLSSPDQLKYALIDLDGNGVDELVITDGRVIYDLYTYANGAVKHVISGAERNSYMLSSDNTIINHASGSAAYSIYGFYRFIGSALVVDQLVVLDAAKDPQHPWFHGFIEEDLRPISEEEANHIIASYENAAIDGVSLTLWGK